MLPINCNQLPYRQPHKNMATCLAVVLATYVVKVSKMRRMLMLHPVVFPGSGHNHHQDHMCVYSEFLWEYNVHGQTLLPWLHTPLHIPTAMAPDTSLLYVVISRTKTYFHVYQLWMFTLHHTDKSYTNIRTAIAHKNITGGLSKSVQLRKIFTSENILVT